MRGCHTLTGMVLLAIAVTVAACSFGPDVENALEDTLEQHYAVGIPLVARTVTCRHPLPDQSRHCKVAFADEIGIPAVDVVLPAGTKLFPAAFVFEHKRRPVLKEQFSYSVDLETDFDGLTLSHDEAVRALAATLEQAYAAGMAKAGDAYKKRLVELANLQSYE